MWAGVLSQLGDDVAQPAMDENKVPEVIDVIKMRREKTQPSVFGDVLGISLLAGLVLGPLRGLWPTD